MNQWLIFEILSHEMQIFGRFYSSLSVIMKRAFSDKELLSSTELSQYGISTKFCLLSVSSLLEIVIKEVHYLPL